ncbi:hypothetical protein MLD38_009406 [Melastoma candidum]|uniref:Uncharacterized protein n=1 Tax=Melastoma candidum TaxID=119954 RepID=A0ACB9RXE9_9MYRT|nr:hypothetical protein MLD38_009406 [Melastoma candidum]
MKPTQACSLRFFRPGVRLMWSLGFALVALSLYATTRLPPLGDPIATADRGAAAKSLPTITIFAAPGPFVGPYGQRQGLAVRSWLGLSPQVTVVLFSRDHSVVAFARGLSSRVMVEPEIDFSFLGTPFFHSMVARSQKFVSDISVFMDAETVTLPDFLSALNFVHGENFAWFLFASTCNVSHIPFQLDAEGKHWLKESGKRVEFEEMQEVLGQCCSRSRLEDRMLLAWNRMDLPLHHGVLPPFLYGKGIHNVWLINEVLSSKLRTVLDASCCVSGLYIANNTPNFTKEPPLTSVESEINERDWESMGNALVGTAYGSLIFHEAKNSRLLRLLKCNGAFLFVNGIDYTTHVSARENMFGFLEKKILHIWGKEKTIRCVEDCMASGNAYSWPRKDEPASINFPFSLEALLPTLVDNNKTIILGVAGYSYKDMLMSWVCRLRALRLTNFVVCALDPETYEFSLLQGLAVFKDESAPNEISFDDCHFGTECFQKVTKVKSRIVTRILKLGYNVMMSDVDVYWFRNPLPYVSSFGPAVLVAQSDEYNETGPINMPRRLNSGFYFAHSDESTIAAMEKIVKHAATSGLSEQPSFYDILCGEGGTNRLGNDVCIEPETNLTVHFLDRNLFPNGAYAGLWDEMDVKESCLKKGCYILHNNWISGRRRKLERQVMKGLWKYNMATRMCLQSWHKVEIVG